MKKIAAILAILFAVLNIACAKDTETKKVNEIYLTANGTTWTVTLEQNKSSAALVELLKKGNITIHAHDYGSFEKVGNLPQSLPRTDRQISTKPGDLILYQGNQITIYYDTNSWSFTKLGHIKGATRQNMLSVLGSGDVDLVLSVEK